ncbi:hypothetical protein PV416_34280 [Streptomyces ipomoeae]|uniref:hypothetical protein n=1 Tax=Streptomyces ipomoeae TaxID=103232 RepID=UPI0029B8789C|nr:hypothetical protein [Streptomyces ipomoeae]MDX2826001.1 hypothetical protein [Streptomyces ipomoeae]MDX2878718.1 hypothetical protein [Streptomyces ipomoeae]
MASYLVTHHFGRPWPLELEEIISPVLAGIGVIFLFTGLTMAMVGKRLASRKAPASSS